MSKIRVLVADDNYFVRKLLSGLFNDDGQIEVVGEAKNGLEAVEMARKLRPDVITMDYDMPKMNGAEATENILAGEQPLPAIIMFSAATKQEEEETLESLRVGAVDFVAKPSGVLLDMDKVRDQLVFKVKLAAIAKVRAPRRLEKAPSVKTSKRAGVYPRATSGAATAVELVVIGSSTGGTPAVEDILVSLPAGLKSAVLVVQHMPEKFTKNFAERLNRLTAYPTKEAAEGDIINKGACLIAPGNYHMEALKQADGRLAVHLNQEKPQHGLRPAIDVTMKSLADNFSGPILGIILTGMGKDGTEGMMAIKAKGGRTLVQSPDTAVVDSMPSSVIESGLADEIMPLHDIARRIVELSGG